MSVAARTRFNFNQMIEEFVREMTAAERADLEQAMRWQPTPVRPSTPQGIGLEAVGLVVLLLLALGAIWLAGGRDRGGLVFAAVVGGIFVVHHVISTARTARPGAYAQDYMERRRREIVRVLEDGRATVKRVHAVAVVEMEPIEDEGMGYVFDLGDGRVLFLKGQDYFALDEDALWPNTDFEIVRAVADGTMLDLRCHGTALAPLRTIPGDALDPQKGWDEREEVLEMSVDDAVRTVLRER